MIQSLIKLSMLDCGERQKYRAVKQRVKQHIKLSIHTFTCNYSGLQNKIWYAGLSNAILYTSKAAAFPGGTYPTLQMCP